MLLSPAKAFSFVYTVFIKLCKLLLALALSSLKMPMAML
jgi:hypothetical protein